MPPQDDAPHPNAPPFAEPYEDGGVLEQSAEGYYSDDAATLGDRLAAARAAAGLTKTGLAAKLGVTAKLVSSWENDRSEPRANRLATLAGLLNVSVTWLLTGGGEGVSAPDAAPAAASKCVAFHLSLLVDDLDAARRFYGDALGAPLGRSAETWQDFDFFGCQLSVHLGAPSGRAAALVDGAQTPMPHFGVVLGWDEWGALVERLRGAGAEFLREPTVRFVGAPEEQGAFFLTDPAGNAIEFKALRAPSALFAETGAVEPAAAADPAPAAPAAARAGRAGAA